MFNVQQITQLHREMVIHWHSHDVENPFHGSLALVCQQHGYNFLLWHQEDIARSPQASDAEIAGVKRRIDQLNQQRNDGMEKLDEYLAAKLAENWILPISDATQNTESPGAVIDRLSILSLRIYHLEEQTQRIDVTAEHIESVQRKLAIALVQLEDLATALEQLLAEIMAGRKRHRLYRQLKMYNDPALNPYLYAALKRAG